MRYRIVLPLLLLATGPVLALAAITSGDEMGQSQPPGEEQILASVEAKKGFRPPALMLMATRKGTLPAFMAYGNGLFEGGPLTEKEAYLVALAAAVALKSPVCMKAHSASAVKAGASADEVRQAALIAGLISGTSALHVAFESVDVLNQE
jgi:AhpD family alkylhydroperoxidase